MEIGVFSPIEWSSPIFQCWVRRNETTLKNETQSETQHTTTKIADHGGRGAR